MESSNNELISEFDKCKREIFALKNELNQVNALKESWFQKKEQIDKEISGFISKIKELKKQRDHFTGMVKDNKRERDNNTKLMKERIEDVKKLRLAKKEFMKKHNIKKEPDQLKREISKIETRIETEALPFEHEKKLMERIKSIKKELNEAKELIEINTKISTISADINRFKRASDDAHAKIQDFARQSQARHDGMLKIMKQVDELRAKEKEANKNSQESKAKFTELNEKLEKNLPLLQSLKDELNKRKAEMEREKRLQLEKEFAQIDAQIKEKIKRGKKLTTDDLLTFQRMAMHEKEPDI